MNWQDIMEKICTEYRAILGDNLTGVYVHGSIAFGCFHPDKSDIDFLAVTREIPSEDARGRMIGVLLRLAPHAPEKGIEMSAVLEKDCLAPVHPIPYWLHYSTAHHDAYLRDMPGTLARLRGVDPDLAAHFTVARAVGIALLGSDAREMFAEVNAADYLDSIRSDVENAADDVLNAPVYILLNLCRVLAYVREGAVISKAGGGEWGLQNLPGRWRPLLQKALHAYRTGAPLTHDAADLRSFAQEMLQNINNPVYPK